MLTARVTHMAWLPQQVVVLLPEPVVSNSNDQLKQCLMVWTGISCLEGLCQVPADCYLHCRLLVTDRAELWLWQQPLVNPDSDLLSAPVSTPYTPHKKRMHPETLTPNKQPCCWSIRQALHKCRPQPLRQPG